jgi:hypothetical protein
VSELTVCAVMVLLPIWMPTLGRVCLVRLDPCHLL